MIKPNTASQVELDYQEQIENQEIENIQRIENYLF